MANDQNFKVKNGLDAGGNITGASIIKSGGASTEFLKADGSVDSSTYLLSSSYTATDVLAKLLTVDGSSSGLNADLIDGVHLAGLTQAPYSQDADANNLTAYSSVASSNLTSNMPSSAGWYNIVNIRHRGGQGDGVNYGGQIAMQMTSTSPNLYFRSNYSAGNWSAWRQVWHSDNDGSGSGLDADLLDGQQGSYYAPLASPAFTGTPTAPTPTAADNSTKIATTAYVDNAVAGGGGGDAATLNGLDSTQFLRSDTADSASGLITFVGGASFGSGAEDRLWSSADTDIDGLIPGTSAGRLSTSTSNGHYVIGLKSNDTADGFYVLDQGTVGTTGTEPFINVVFAASGNTLQYFGNEILRDDMSVSTQIVLDVKDADFILQDSTDGVANWLWRDHSASSLFIGTAAAQPKTRYDLYTDGGSKYWHAGNDGSGSGLDADLWDGNQFATYLNQALLTTSSPTFSTLNLGYDLTFESAFHRISINDGGGNIQWRFAHDYGDTNAGQYTCTETGYTGLIQFTQSNGNMYIGPNSATSLTAGNTFTQDLSKGILITPSTVTIQGGTAWHSGNDGSGSGLDADTVDGLQSTSFLRADAANSTDVRLASGAGRGLRFWDSDQYKIYMSSATDGTWGGRVGGETTSDYNMYFRMDAGTNRGWNFKQNTTVVAGIDASGNGRFAGNITAYSSDARLKVNQQPIQAALDKVMSISGYTFDWDIEKCKEVCFTPTNLHEHGVLAQEVQKIVPDAVTMAAFHEDYLTVSYDRLVPLLIEAIKEQQEIIDEQKRKIESFEERLLRIEEMIR